jgi:phosphate transport system permease protein
MRRRKLEELFFSILMILATILVTGSFFLIIGTILFKGLPYMNLDMITKTPGGGFYIGKEGGVVNAIIGSRFICGGATILGLLIIVPVAILIKK